MKFYKKHAVWRKIFNSCVLLFFISFSYGQQQVLSYYLENARKNSPLLKDLTNQAASGNIDKDILSAGLGPQVQGISFNSYAPVIGGYGYDEVITNKGNFSTLMAVTKQIVSKANRQNQYNQIELTNQSVQNSRAISEQELTRLVTDEYITAYGSWQQFQFTNEICQLLQSEDSLLLRLTQNAVYRQTDYLTFLVTFKQQKLALLQAKAQFENDLAGLNRDCGLIDSSFIQLQEPALPNPLLPAADSTVFYRKFILDSLLLTNQAEHIDFGYKPVVNLFADAGFTSSLTYLPYKNFGMSFGISLVVPIYDGHQRKLQHNKIALAEQTRQSYASTFKSQYAQQVVQLQQQLHAAAAIVQSANEQLRYSKALVDANRKLLVQGDVRIADYVIAINNYLSARNVITINAQKILFITNQLNYWKK